MADPFSRISAEWKYMTKNFYKLWTSLEILWILTQNSNVLATKVNSALLGTNGSPGVSVLPYALVVEKPDLEVVKLENPVSKVAQDRQRKKLTVIRQNVLMARRDIQMKMNMACRGLKLREFRWIHFIKNAWIIIISSALCIIWNLWRKS